MTITHYEDLENTTNDAAQRMSAPADPNEVEITAMYFRGNGKSAEGRLDAYPRRMVYDGREYTFVDSIRYLVHKGQQLIQLFDVSDGVRQFRLRCEDDRWTLVASKGAY